ncbi:hypothetical protein MSAN_02434400 [Mycena sanguinolenta]|uniref:Uncharacterized protein n=1 Tax=Mycena sanguinolenta TaxID=230812 RepID=A0A8H6WYR2_9AGAR|nr:hypothetical protein MSAN_02434400 [Mycena sanguinolenta]
MKDRHTSVPLKSTNWDPYTKGRPPPPPPPPRANKHTKPTVQPSFPPPPQRGGSTADSSAPSPSPSPGPPPIVRPSAAPGPPPIVRATRPSLPSSSSSPLPPPPMRTPVLSRFRQPEPEPEPEEAAPPPPPIRRVAARTAEKETEIDWANLSSEDKEVFFGWLDEFFSRHLNRPIGVAT